MNGREALRRAAAEREVMLHKIARLAHEVNRAYCAALGDYTVPSWSGAPAWMRRSAVAGVDVAMLYPRQSPREQHEAWRAAKVEEGWRHGAVKDAAARTHPCLVAYDDLPPEQRVKDYLFLAVVRALTHDDPVPLVVGEAPESAPAATA